MIPCGEPEIVIEDDKCYCDTPMYAGNDMHCTERRLVMTKEAFIQCYNAWIKDANGGEA